MLLNKRTISFLLMSACLTLGLSGCARRPISYMKPPEEGAPRPQPIEPGQPEEAPTPQPRAVEPEQPEAMPTDQATFINHWFELFSYHVKVGDIEQELSAAQYRDRLEEGRVHLMFLGSQEIKARAYDRELQDDEYCEVSTVLSCAPKTNEHWECLTGERVERTCEFPDGSIKVIIKGNMTMKIIVVGEERIHLTTVEDLGEDVELFAVFVVADPDRGPVYAKAPSKALKQRVLASEPLFKKLMPVE